MQKLKPICVKMNWKAHCHLKLSIHINLTSRPSILHSSWSIKNWSSQYIIAVTVNKLSHSKWPSWNYWLFDEQSDRRVTNFSPHLISNFIGKLHGLCIFTPTLWSPTTPTPNKTHTGTCVSGLHGHLSG